MTTVVSMLCFCSVFIFYWSQIKKKKTECYSFPEIVTIQTTEGVGGSLRPCNALHTFLGGKLLIDNVFVQLGGRIFNQQNIGIPIDTNCAPLLADLFLHAYESDFLQRLPQNKDKKIIDQTFHSSFHYIDDE